MRLGAPLFARWNSPEEWADTVTTARYRAAYAPVDEHADAQTIAAYRQIASAHDIIIAEVGAWSNPLSVDATTRAQAITFCQARLALADELGARCCVNIAGSRGSEWDGPDAANYTEDTFALIVDTVREIIDAVNPTNTYYTLETMPWMYPDSPESYLSLIKAIDRPQFAAHLDPINMINSVERFYRHRLFISHCIDVLGPYIRACHIKDMVIERPFVVSLRETAPGRGSLDYAYVLRQLQRLESDTPVLLEHLSEAAEYDAAATYVRAKAAEVGIEL
ncbi:MAG: sugar phosphate isomerase/epimerase family protein [Chloroflexota bacterium]|jgi:sugar phosphate isomerase/epimerase